MASLSFPFREIQLIDKPLFEDVFLQNPPEISEYTFTNLFMWRQHYQFQWIPCGNGFFLRSFRSSPEIEIFPPASPDITSWAQILGQIRQSETKPIRIHRVPESQLELFRVLSFPYQVIEDRANWDYIYRISDLAQMAGGEYANERKKINKFKSRYAWRYFSLNRNHINSILRMQDAWCGVRACDEHIGLAAENFAIQEILIHWDSLSLIGGGIFIENDLIAYTIAEPLNPSTIVVHIEKANGEFPGVYQAITQLFCESLGDHYQYINREQDLGEENLRRAKENYHPCHFLKKYQILIPF